MTQTTIDLQSLSRMLRGFLTSGCDLRCSWVALDGIKAGG